MALIPALRRGAVDSGLSYFYLEDNTGVYNVTTNPGGYGTLNPARNTLALYVYGYKYRSTTPEALTIGNTIPLTATQWQVPMGEDGYYYFTLLAIPIWDTVPTYTINTIVYYQTHYYIAIAISTNQDPINNPTKWQLITDLTTTAIQTNPSIYYATFNTVVNYRGKVCLQTQTYLEAKCNCNCDDNNRSEVRPYQKVAVMIATAGYLCAQQKYAQADDELVALSQYCSTLNCEGC
jgi:hypothetical protein